MHYYIAYSTTGQPVAFLEAADRTDAELYALRELRAFGRLSEVEAPEAAEARLAAGYLGHGLNPAQAQIAAEDTLALLRPRMIVVGRQEAQLLVGTPPCLEALREITPQGRGLQHAVELKEAGDGDAHKGLEESWRRLHPEWSDAQIRVAVEGQ